MIRYPLMTQFGAYWTWLGKDARAGAIPTSSMDCCLAVEIVEFEFARQM